MVAVCGSLSTSPPIGAQLLMMSEHDFNEVITVSQRRPAPRGGHAGGLRSRLFHLQLLLRPFLLGPFLLGVLLLGVLLLGGPLLLALLLPAPVLRTSVAPAAVVPAAVVPAAVAPAADRGSASGAAAQLLAAASQQAPASQRRPSVAELIEKVEKARAGQRTLVGDFTQRKRVSLFRNEERATGHFLFRHPGQLRWEYVSPEWSAIIFDGTRFAVKMPGQRSVTSDLGRQPGLKALLERLLAALGPASFKAAVADFDPKVTGPQALLLVPRGEGARHLVNMEMRFDTAWQVASVSWRETSGEQTSVTFSGLRRNVLVDDTDFRP